MLVDNFGNINIIKVIIVLNARKRKVSLRILLQRAFSGEKKQRILRRKWPWSSAPRF